MDKSAEKSVQKENQMPLHLIFFLYTLQQSIEEFQHEHDASEVHPATVLS